MQSRFKYLKPRVEELRREGLSYTQINERLGVQIPKSTLSSWCSAIVLSPEAQANIKRLMSGTEISRAIASLHAKERRTKRRQEIVGNHHYLVEVLENSDTAKIALMMLYLGEGVKNERRMVLFGNSNPHIISLFMKLFIKVYQPDISKFRIRIQCRADQDKHQLEEYWRTVINIPNIRFYATWSDPRTIGKPTKKEGYKGVCCIGYIDNRIQFELVNVGKFLCQ